MTINLKNTATIQKNQTKKGIGGKVTHVKQLFINDTEIFIRPDNKFYIVMPLPQKETFKFKFKAIGHNGKEIIQNITFSRNTLPILEKNSLSLKSKFPYKLIVGTFKSKNTAISAIKSFNKKGITTFIRRSPSQLYQIQAGAFENLKAAKKFKSTLTKRDINSYIIIKSKFPYKLIVGTFKSKNTAISAIKSFNKKGITTFIRRSQSQLYQIQAGAFENLKAAKKFKSTLTKRNINSYIIKI
jgi:hypothetical protein